VKLPVAPISPNEPGLSIRAGADGERQVVVGPGGWIAWFTNEAKLEYATNATMNADAHPPRRRMGSRIRRGRRTTARQRLHCLHRQRADMRIRKGLN
jgi:hypothetical protein